MKNYLLNNFFFFDIISVDNVINKSNMQVVTFVLVQNINKTILKLALHCLCFAKI